MCSVTFLSKTNLLMGPTINVLILNVMPLLCTHNCISARNLNILTILSALETLECFSFFLNNTLLFAKSVNFSLRFIEI